MDKNGVFTSKNLLFRGINENDAEIIVQWRNQIDQIQYLENSVRITLESHLDWYKKYVLDNTRYDYLIMLRDTNVPVGVVGVKNIRENTSCEISYMIGDKNQRCKGYAKESVNALLDILVNEGFQTVLATVHKDNSASARVANQAGFLMDDIKGEFFILKQILDENYVNSNLLSQYSEKQIETNVAVTPPPPWWDRLAVICCFVHLPLLILKGERGGGAI